MSVAEEPINATPPPADGPPGGAWWERLRRWLRESKPQFQVGTLRYTGLGMLMIFVWLLWGDLVWTVMENIFPASMPLQLDRLGVPREWIGYLMGTAGAVINSAAVVASVFRSTILETTAAHRIASITLWGLVSVPRLMLTPAAW